MRPEDDPGDPAFYRVGQTGVEPARPPEPNYPCEECGAPRTKAQGGTTFTVCDACWDKAHGKEPEMTEDELQAIEATCDAAGPQSITGGATVPETKKLIAEVRRLRDVVRMASNKPEVVDRRDVGDKDFCMWCSRDNHKPHTYDCAAFTPSGDV